MARIGRGDIATALTDREGFTFFCSGASNREPLTDRARQQELNRIWRMSQTDNVGMFTYVSTLSIYYSDSEYTEHKRDMENLVKRSFDNYCILRIGNITFGTNPNTLINYLKGQHERGEEMRIEDTHRYLIDAEELNHWVTLIPKSGKHEINISGKRVKVDKIVELIKEGKL